MYYVGGFPVCVCNVFSLVSMCVCIFARSDVSFLIFVCVHIDICICKRMHKGVCIFVRQVVCVCKYVFTS